MLSKNGCVARKRLLSLSILAGLACLIGLNTICFLDRHSYETTITDYDVSSTTPSRTLSFHERHALCSAHDIPSYRPEIAGTNDQRKVYDLFMLNTEVDWLEIRLHELASQVDYFVILEAPTTFTGLPKKMYYQENRDKFKKFQAQIIHHVLKPPEKGHPGVVDNGTLVPGTPEYEAHAWTMERYQRNAMFSQVLPFLDADAAPRQDDVIIVSDIDEIPRPATVQLLRECQFGRITTLRSRFYYYSFQWLHRGQEWAHPQATTYQGPDLTILPASLRERDGSMLSIPDSEKQTIWNSSWHCSSCFSTTAEMLAKMKSFSHTNLNAEKFKNKERMIQRIRQGKDLWDRWFQWYARVEDNQDLPRYLSKEAKKGRFTYMIDRDGEGAGFTDYP